MSIMSSKARRLTYLLLALPAAVLPGSWSGCSSNPPGPPYVPPQVDLGPPQYGDISQLPPPQDYGPPADFAPRPDTAPGDARADTSQDGGPPCDEPKNLTCPSACASSQLCVQAMGPRCAERITLSGKADDPAVLAAIATAYVGCWKKSPSADEMCGTFDSCALDGLITGDKVRQWVCNQAQVLDFPDGTTYDEARSICACGTLQFIHRADWKVGIEAGKRAKLCLWYNVGPLVLDDWLRIDYCENFTL